MTTASLPVCDSPEELTAEWVTAALATAGVATPVAAVRFERVGTGQMGTSYRPVARLHGPCGRSGRGRPPPPWSPRWPPATRTPARSSPRATGTSVGLLPRAGRHPRRAHPAVLVPPPSPTTGRLLHLLLDDLAPAVPGNQATGVSLDEATHAVVNLAGLHGPRWGDASLLEMPWLSRHTTETAEFYAEVLAGPSPPSWSGSSAAWPRRTRTRSESRARHLGRLAHDPARAVRRHPRRLPARQPHVPGPRAPGSRRSTGRRVAVGLPGRDIGYLLATSLDLEVRRTEECRIVETYRACSPHGVDRLLGRAVLRRLPARRAAGPTDHRVRRGVRHRPERRPTRCSRP